MKTQFIMIALAVAVMAIPSAFAETTDYDLNVQVGVNDYLRNIVGSLTNTDGQWTGDYTTDGKNTNTIEIVSGEFVNVSTLRLQGTIADGPDRVLTLYVVPTEDGYDITGGNLHIVKDNDGAGLILKNIPVQLGTLNTT